MFTNQVTLFMPYGRAAYTADAGGWFGAVQAEPPKQSQGHCLPKNTGATIPLGFF